MTHTPDMTTTTATQPLAALLQQSLEQVFQLALNHHQAGQHKEAEELYRTVLEIQPDHPDANHGLGVLAVARQRPAAGLEHFRLALVGDTEREQFWLSYIDALIQAGDVEVARKMLALGLQSGLNGKATDSLVVRLGGQDVLTATALSLKKNAPNKTARQAQVKCPSNKEMSKAVRLFEQGKLVELQPLANSLIKRFPLHGFGWKLLGNLHHANDRIEEAVRCMKKTVALLPDDAEAHTNLTTALYELGRPAEALPNARRALALDPDNGKVICNLGVTLYALGKLDEAAVFLRRATALQPDDPKNHSNLGLTLQDQGQITEAIQVYRRMLALQPNFAWGHSNLLFCLSLDANTDAQQLLAEHLAFGEQFEAPLRAGWQAHTNSKDPDRCLQVGFVSGDLYNHAVASFLEPVLVNLARNTNLSLHAYYTRDIQDDVMLRLRTYFPHWNTVKGLDDAALANKIRSDRIDILIDLSGHTGNNRLVTFAHKPAPIQISWIGYPGTTGLQAMDYYQADRFFAPPGLLDGQFSEKLVQLPALAPFQISAFAPLVNELPALRKGHITFGSFNRVNKIGRPVIALWAQVLRALPTAQMLIGGMPTDENTNIRQWFEDEGIETGRLQFHPKASIQSYLTLHHQVDICLDTFPYNGGTTTLHALSMGVPTLTLTGQTAASRAGACNLGQVGLDDFVAHDQDDFVQRALHWANHLEELSHIRADLRQQLSQSPAGQADVIAVSVAQAWRTMWQRWCAGLPAQSFEVVLEN